MLINRCTKNICKNIWKKKIVLNRDKVVWAFPTKWTEFCRFKFKYHVENDFFFEYAVSFQRSKPSWSFSE